MNRILKFIPLIFAVVILYFLIAPNYENIIRVYRESSRIYLFLSFFSVILSYVFMSISLYEMLKLMGYRLKFMDTFTITLVSTTVNYLFSSAGASGFALRTHLLTKRNIPITICLTISVFLTAMIYLVLGFIVFQSFVVYLIQTKKLSFQIFEGFIGAFFIFLISFLLTIILYNHRFRNRWAIRLYYFVNSTLYQITKYQIPKEDFRHFKNNLNTGVHILHRQKYELPKVIFFIIMDWIFNILVLYFAFFSVGIKISLVNMIIGFSFGIIMTIIPILPSGLGAMEFVIANFYSNYGIPIEAAIFASLVFRIFYYIIPAIISIILFYGMKTADPEIELKYKEEK